MLAGDAKSAVTSFEKALALQPSLAEARFNRGVALLKLEQYAKASADFEAIFADERSPLRASAAYHHGLALDRLGRSEDAEKWLDRATVLDSSLDAALLYIGAIRERRGDLQSAGRAYLDYLKKHPDDPTAMLRFGISAQRAGRPDTAKKYLERVVAVAPASAQALEARKFLVMWE